MSKRRQIASPFDSSPFAMREGEVEPLLRARAAVTMRADYIDEILELEREAPELSVQGGVALIPVHGTIGYGLAEWEKRYCGMVDAVDVATLVDQALTRGDVRAIMLHVSSPGGTVMGMTETAAKLYAARAQKPVVTFARGYMASAAYWIGSQATAVYATTSSLVGSIGVYSALWDTSKAAEQAGYARILVSSAPRKGLPQSGLKIDDAQLAMIRERVEAYAKMFVDDAQRGRAGTISANAFDGGEWIAAEAAQRGLIDDVIDNEADAIAAALEL